MNPQASPGRPLVIGLLGGIAAGKSTVGRIFAEHGFRLIDADLVARGVVTEPDVAQQIRSRFGPTVFDASGTLDRATLAEIVFADCAARRDLEAIIHPRVRQTIRKDLEKAQHADKSVVLDVPLLLEHDLIDACDENIFLDADDATREARAQARGWPADELTRRERTQATLQAKRDRCRFTVHTDGSLDDTRLQIEAIIATLSPTHP